LNKIGLEIIWEERENLGRREFKRIRTTCNNIGRRNIFAKILEKASLTDYFVVKGNFGREDYIMCCSRDKRKGWAWQMLGIWRLKGCRRETRNGQYPMCRELEAGKHSKTNN
jgi:hypothetical protein